MNKQPKKRGAPTGYKPQFCAQAEKLCLLGATDAQLAEFFEVSTRTIYRWINEHSEFCQSLKVAKEEADRRVERSLYNRAVGYSHEAVKIFMPAGADAPVYAPYTQHVPPDTTAMIFWLKNRQSGRWRDVQRHEVGGVGDFTDLSDAELVEIIRGTKARTGTRGESSDGTGETPDPEEVRSESDRVH